MTNAGKIHEAGQKKTPDSQAPDHSKDAKPSMRAKKPSAKSDEGAGSANRMRTLGSVALSQASIVVVATALALALVFPDFAAGQ